MPAPASRTRGEPAFCLPPAKAVRIMAVMDWPSPPNAPHFPPKGPALPRAA